jgi:hypothetical protein
MWHTAPPASPLRYPVRLRRGCSFSNRYIELTPTEELFYDKFQPWLQQKLGITSVTSWAKLIMLTCHGEKKGFEKFFQLLNKFSQQKHEVTIAA